MKRKATPAQLRALKKGRRIRAQNLKKRKRKTPKKKTRRMAKRRRIDNTLTGGTGDVCPQYYHGTIRLKATDTVTEIGFQLPIPRVPTTGRATIIEVLRVFWMPTQLKNMAVAQKRLAQHISFSTIAQGEVTLAGFNEPNVFAQMAVFAEGAFTAAGSYLATFVGPQVYELTDSAGHGFLLATDRVFVQAVTDDFTPDVGTFHFKILYRFKAVPLQEYIGIVQSQQ